MDESVVFETHCEIQYFLFSRLISLNPVGKNRRKSSLKECIFDNKALYFECQINKNAPLQKRTPSDCSFGDFAHWEGEYFK